MSCNLSGQDLTDFVHTTIGINIYQHGERARGDASAAELGMAKVSLPALSSHRQRPSLILEIVPRNSRTTDLHFALQHHLVRLL